MNTQIHRERYVQDAIATASPARLLTMLYDRLVRDLNCAELAIVAGELAEANSHIMHAQDIVLELRTSLDTTVWRGGPGLSELYGYIYGELIQANVRKEKQKVSDCLKLVEPLRDAWYEAALIAVGGTAQAG
jgi:flagellar secretion chaperone FliS